MAQRFRDEAGNIWEMGPDGQPRFVSPGQVQTKPADPTIPFKIQQERGQAAAAPFAAPKAQAEAAIAQAQAPFAGTVASAEAQKAQADAAKAQAELQIAQAKAKGKPVEDARAELQRIIGKIDAIARDANDNAGWFETGYLGSINRDRPGTAAFDLARDINTIDANSAFAKLSQMRAESPTGGALGNVTEKELELLKSTISNLDPNQSHASFLNNLKIARDHYAGLLNRLGGDTATLSTPEMGISNSGTSDEFDPDTAAAIDRMIRAGDSNRQIIAFAKSQGYTKQPPSAEQLDAAKAFLKANPNYTGGFTQAITRQPTDDNTANAVTGALGIDPNSALGAYGVASANALTAGTLDEIAGGDAQRAKDLLRQQYPGASFAGDITGSALGMTGLNAGLRFGGLAPLATRAGGIGGDALYGAAFGAGESNDNRAMGALFGAGAAAGGNVIGRGLVSGAGRAARGISNPAVNYLAQRGVRMTPGQLVGQGGMFGRGYRAVEDALESVPVLGSAIRARKAEGVRDFNREAFKDALAPINQQVEGEIGQDAIGTAQDMVSDAYGGALGGVRLRADGPFIRESDRAIQAGSKVPVVGEQFNYLAANKLDPLFDERLGLDAKGFQTALQTLSRASSDFPKQGIMGGEVAGHARDLRGAFIDLANRQAPGTVPALNAANAANKNVSILGDAVNTAVNNNIESGMFTPAQLGRAAVNNTKKFGGKRAAARGDVPFRELQQAGQAVLPNVVPNSGTTDRALATLVLPAALGGSAAGSEMLGAPDWAVGTLAGLGALSTRKGNDLVQKLLTSRSPQVRKLGEHILMKRRAAGMFGGATAVPLVVGP